MSVSKFGINSAFPSVLTRVEKLLAIVSLLVLSSAANALPSGAEPFIPNADHYFSLEAESAEKKSVAKGGWENITSGDSSNGLSMKVSASTYFFNSSGSGPGLLWGITPVVSGSYEVWARFRTQDGDSLFVELDGDTSTHHLRIGKDWSWKKLRTIKLIAQTNHQLGFYARENLLEVDKVVVQLSGKRGPVSLGPVESSRNAALATTDTSESESSESIEIVDTEPQLIEETVKSEVTEPENPANENTSNVGGIFLQGDDKFVSLEAESAAVNVRNGTWKQVENSSFSSGMAMSLESAPRRSDVDNATALSWTLKAKYSGKYKIMALIRNAGSNSVYSNFDGDQGFQYFFSSPKWSWRVFWNRQLELVAGTEHTLQILARDSGVEIDKILVLPADSSYSPEGMGPAETLQVAGESSESVEESTEVPDNLFVQGDEQGVSLEAENAEISNQFGAWKEIESSVYSNSAALSLEKASGRASYDQAPKMQWKFKAAHSGAYRIWALMRNTDGNSVYSSFDGSHGFQYFIDSSVWSWRMFLNRGVILEAGQVHTLSILGRDSGVDIDKVMLLPVNGGGVPTGLGLAETSRGNDKNPEKDLVQTDTDTETEIVNMERFFIAPPIPLETPDSSSETDELLQTETEEETSSPDNAEEPKEEELVIDRFFENFANNSLSDHYPGTENYAKEVNIPSCDDEDAVRISTVEGLRQIEYSHYRVFCIAPGDYRSYGLLSLPSSGGTEDEPKVIRFESSQFGDDDEIFRANKTDLARMPAMDIRNTSNWIVHRLAFMEISGMPIRLSGAENIVIDRIRLEHNRSGIEFRHATHNSYLQNSYIGNQVVPQGSGNDGVCVAFMGHFRQHLLGGHIEYDYPVQVTGNHIVNNEIFNCNDGIQIVWMHHYHQIPDFQGTVLAGNDVYLDETMRTNCYGAKDPNGNCTHMENPIDLKGGSLDSSNPVRIYDNRLWGYRKTDSNYNRPANSWGSGISGHYRSVQNIHIYENVIWDVPSAVAFVRGTFDSVIRDNIFTQITGEGINNGIALVTTTDSTDLGTYKNVKRMDVNRNHIVISTDGSSTGASWFSSSAEDSNFYCNVVANGSWTHGRMTGSKTGENTWYGTNAGALSRGGDGVFSSFDASTMGRLCFDVKKASIPGGERQCLDGVLHKPGVSKNVCASDYWTTDRWPSE